jgi:hypothetical protein
VGHRAGEHQAGDSDKTLSSIDIPSRHHSINDDRLCLIIDLVKDSVIPHTNPVAISCG